MGSYDVFIHPLAQVHHTVRLGNGCQVWTAATILEGAQLGEGCIVGACSFLGAHSLVGQRCIFHTGSQIPNNTVIGDFCMIGPAAILTDCAHPNLRDRSQEVHRPPVLGNDVVLGAGSIILPGVVIGDGAQIGAGAVVTRDIAPGAVVCGNPARLHIRSSVVLGREGLA